MKTKQEIEETRQGIIACLKEMYDLPNLRQYIDQGKLSLIDSRYMPIDAMIQLGYIKLEEIRK